MNLPQVISCSYSFLLPTVCEKYISLCLILHNLFLFLWSVTEFLCSHQVYHEVLGSIPDSTVGIFPKGEDSRGDYGLGRLVEFRFKGPFGTTSSYITTHIIGAT